MSYAFASVALACIFVQCLCYMLLMDAKNSLLVDFVFYVKIQKTL